MARGSSSRSAGGASASTASAGTVKNPDAGRLPAPPPDMQFPVPLDRSVLPRFDPLLSDFRDVLQNIATAIDHTSDVAVALKEVGDDEEVETLDKSVKGCIALAAALKDSERFLIGLKSKLNREGKLENLIAQVEENEAKFKKSWNEKTEAQKYNATDEYIDFWSKLWEVEHGNKPMPPLPTGDNDEEELIVGTQKVSLTCPLTTRLFEDPYTSSVCNHSFSRVAILAYIKQHSGNAACPIPGCDKFLKADLMQFNARLASKVRRHKRKQEDAEQEEEGEYTVVE